MKHILMLFLLASCNTFAASFDEIMESAESGNKYAQHSLALMYLEGTKNISLDHTEAERWFLKAAKQGIRDAQFNLGTLYNRGDMGVQRSYESAAYWFLQAARQEDVNAQYNLGLAYASGKGVLKNNIRAYVWWTIASNQGHRNAAHNLNIVRKRLSSKELAGGEVLLSSCESSNYQDCD